MNGRSATPEENRIGGFLGIAAKAGKLVYGTELCREAIRAGEGKKSPYLVLIASDAAEGTVKRIVNCCRYYEKEVRTLPLTADALSHATGRPGLIACVALTDEGFAAAVKERLEKMETKPGKSQQTEVDG